jgi:hypothetical protein
MPPLPLPPLSGGPKQPKKGMHISALAGIDDTDKKETAVANDKAIRPVFIGKISLTLSFPDPIKF